MNTPQAHQAQPASSLPTLSNGVIRRFRKSPPNFDLMLRRLHHTDPAAARWLYGAAEKIASGDVIEKERYATLALGLYYMLNEQVFVDMFEQLCNNAVPVVETADLNELRPEDTASSRT